MQSNIMAFLFAIFYYASSMAQSPKESKAYHPNGRLEHQGYLNENGQKTGEWKFGTPHSNAIKIQNYENGQPHGATKSVWKMVQLCLWASMNMEKEQACGNGCMTMVN